MRQGDSQLATQEVPEIKRGGVQVDKQVELKLMVPVLQEVQVAGVVEHVAQRLLQGSQLRLVRLVKVVLGQVTINNEDML